MSFLTMYSELRGAVPKIPLPYCKTVVNRAYRDLCRQNLWSFQLYESNWISPPLISVGVVTAVQGSNQVVFDAAASAAVIASITAWNPINQRQFRIGVSSIYTVTAFDGVSTLTLDRAYQESSATGVQYSLYQIYYPAPFLDHLTFISVRDMVTFVDLFTDKNRTWLDEQDPQRTYWYFPTHVVPYLRGSDPLNTATYKIMLFELWGAPLSNRSYQLYGLRRGVDLVNNSDELPPPLTEEAVIARGKWYVYEWAEANKGSLPRNQGPDYKFLMGETMATYTRLYKDLRRQDKETVNNFFSIRRSSLYGKYMAHYNTISGTAYPGSANSGW